MERLGCFITDDIPQGIFVIAEVVFADFRAGLDFEIGSMGRDRFGGIQGSLEIAGVDGIEIDVGQSSRHRFGLLVAAFGELRVEVTLGFVVQVSLGFTVANEIYRVRRRVDYSG